MFDAFGVGYVLIPGTVGLVAAIMILSVATGNRSHNNMSLELMLTTRPFIQNITNSCWESVSWVA